MMVKIILENEYEDNVLVIESTEDKKIITMNIGEAHVDVNIEELKLSLRKLSAK